MAFFPSKCDNIPIKKDEADLLRHAIKEKYENLNGTKKLGKTTLKIYKDLADSFKIKFSPEGVGVSFTDSSGTSHPNTQTPGHSFLKNLFCTNKNKANECHHQYQLDLCYLYAFDMMRDAYIKKQKEKDKISVPAKSSPDLTLVVSSINAYGSEIEQVRGKIETFGYSTEKDVREIKLVGIASLVDFYKTPIENKNIVMVIGKTCFENETFITELNIVRKNSSDNFLKNSFVVTLPDLCQGAYSIDSTTGKHKLNESWRKQIQYYDKKIIPEIEKNSNDLTPIKKKEALRQANKEKNDLQKIVSEMEHLIAFIKNARSVTHSHLMNHFTITELNNLLSISSSSISQSELKKIATKRQAVFSNQALKSLK